MKRILTIAALLFCFCAQAQTSFLKEAAAKLDKALVAKDTVVLKQLLHKELTYGHSNGWVETREDVVRDLASGKLVYHAINPGKITWRTDGNWASARTDVQVAVSLDGTRLDMKLHVLQVWLKTNRGWQLIARQSTKIQ
jgi:hypothetical protein